MLGFSGLAMRYMYIAGSGARLNSHEFVFSHYYSTVIYDIQFPIYFVHSMIDIQR